MKRDRHDDVHKAVDVFDAPYELPQICLLGWFQAFVVIQYFSEESAWLPLGSSIGVHSGKPNWHPPT